MTDGLIYLLQGNGHAANLAVAVRSALPHWAGPICLIAGDDKGEEACEGIASEDERISIVRWEAAPGRRNRYANKTPMQRLSPFDRSVFLDADTLCVADGLEALLPENPYSTTLSSWCDWNTKGTKIRKRCNVYRDLHTRHVERMVDGQTPYPAINTGSLGFTKDSLFMRDWEAITSKRVRFICDEIVAQLFYVDYPHTIKDHRWNCSPIFANDTKDVVVYHFHGQKNKKRAKGRAIWLPHFEAAYDENFGNIQHLVQFDGKLFNREHNRPCTDAELLERHGG